jgi:UDP-N-acetyl-D-glucosamine dehydrogenase
MQTTSPVSRAPTRNAAQSVPTRLRSLAIVGLGYVGLPLAILAEERGYEVRGFDVDARRIADLKRRTAPFLSENEASAFRKSAMSVSGDESVLDGASTIVICVPTPVDEAHRPDLGPLIAACETVGRHLKRGGLVVIESTVNPGACEEVALPILERNSGLAVERDFLLAHCPERINPGDERWSVRTIPRVVGAAGPQSLARTLAFYRSIVEGEVIAMNSIKEAEAVKMVENSFRDVNIAFVNELAMSFDKAGIDIVSVIRGASTKPFSFMPHFPGCGVGGHCIPVDPYYLIRYGRENGFEHRFLAAAREINNGMPAYTVDILERMLEEERKKPLAGAHVALLGLAYKRDVPDLRESPALAIRDKLLARGARVRSFDPFALAESSVKSVEEALRGADAAIVATDHTLFRALTAQYFASRGMGIVIDGRNCLDKETFLDAGIAYHGIGR